MESKAGVFFRGSCLSCSHHTVWLLPSQARWVVAAVAMSTSPTTLWSIVAAMTGEAVVVCLSHGHKNKDYPLTPKPWKMKVLKPQYMGYGYNP